MNKKYIWFLFLSYFSINIASIEEIKVSNKLFKKVKSFATKKLRNNIPVEYEVKKKKKSNVYKKAYIPQELLEEIKYNLNNRGNVKSILIERDMFLGKYSEKIKNLISQIDLYDSTIITQSNMETNIETKDKGNFNRIFWGSILGVAVIVIAKKLKQVFSFESKEYSLIGLKESLTKDQIYKSNIDIDKLFEDAKLNTKVLLNSRFLALLNSNQLKYTLELVK